VATDGFALDQRIEDSSVHVADWPLCQVRLKDDARFHWLLLVPRRAGAVEYADSRPTTTPASTRRCWPPPACSRPSPAPTR
jgi:hypothetical protein